MSILSNLSKVIHHKSMNITFDKESTMAEVYNKRTNFQELSKNF